MGNMSYCRFQNTRMDLDDCYKALQNGEGSDKELSGDEKDAKARLIEICKNIAEDFGNGEENEIEPEKAEE